MANNNKLALRTLTLTIEELDIRYMEADVADKLVMKDEAFLAFSRARLRLLQDRVLCNSSCLEKIKEIRQEVKEIRQEVEDAANSQQLIKGIIRLVSFLTPL